ncbi:VOC family protein [Nocardioides sp. GXZ039]|uniref:VOC family protein n=1 Tax=Nocardioides sp. GXZ039 TaxID=3136018 RepID=UPI0030F47FBE
MRPVRALSYAVAETTRIEEWASFATDLLGMQLASRTDDQLRLRIDHKSYRLLVTRGERDQVTALGWEVRGPQALRDLRQRLADAGHVVGAIDPDLARERCVSEVFTVVDPAGTTLELHWGHESSLEPFVSPTGARFVTGAGGMGHAFSFMPDNQSCADLYLDIFGFGLSDIVEFAQGEGWFTHCNPRHHSYAWAQFSGAPPGVAHLMLEVTDLDTVGRAWDRVLLERVAPVAATLGKHSNDEMVSFYVNSPSGFEIEFGTGGLEVDPDDHAPTRFTGANFWGHHRSNPDDPDI